MPGLRLKSDEVRCLSVAQRALLSPLEDQDPVTWQLRANRAVRQLIGADHSVFSVPSATGPTIVSDDIDPAFPARFREYCIGVEGGENLFSDPYLENAGRVRRAGGTGAYHERMLGGAEAMARSPAYQEIFRPAGLTHMIGFSVPLPVGEATQFFSFEGRHAARRSERGTAILDLLVPSFEAGIRIQRDLVSRRTALASMLDRFGQAVALYSSTGRPLHRSRALEELLARESQPDAATLSENVDRLARSLTSRWARARGTASRRADDARGGVRTCTAEYRLHGGYVGAELLGAEGVLVIVERLGAVLPAAEDLCSRFGLTAREAEAALLVAEGLSDRSVAARLGISLHTARRYAERVLRKVGVHSRAAVAVTILGAGD